MGRFTVLAVRHFSLVLISAKNSRVTMKSFIVLSAVLVLAAGKFCPQEKNGDQCVAKDNAYKCAVFFENLSPKRKLTCIGALPDAQKKPRRSLVLMTQKRASVTFPAVKIPQPMQDATQ